MVIGFEVAGQMFEKTEAGENSNQPVEENREEHTSQDQIAFQGTIKAIALTGVDDYDQVDAEGSFLVKFHAWVMRLAVDNEAEFAHLDRECKA